jgi:hypothetical protein
LPCCPSTSRPAAFRSGCPNCCPTTGKAAWSCF